MKKSVALIVAASMTAGTIIQPVYATAYIENGRYYIDGTEVTSTEYYKQSKIDYFINSGFMKMKNLQEAYNQIDKYINLEIPELKIYIEGNTEDLNQLKAYYTSKYSMKTKTLNQSLTTNPMSCTATGPNLGFVSLQIKLSQLKGNNSEIQSVKSIAKSIADSIRDLPRYEQIKYVFDYLCNNISYFDNGTPRAQSIVGALLDKKCSCNGYAEAFQAIMEELNIPSYIVNPYSIDQNMAHTWNIVQLDGKWYYVDVTWADQEDYHYIDYNWFLCGSDKRSGDYVDLPLSNVTYVHASAKPASKPVLNTSEQNPPQVTTQTESKPIVQPVVTVSQSESTVPDPISESSQSKKKVDAKLPEKEEQRQEQNQENKTEPKPVEPEPEYEPFDSELSESQITESQSHAMAVGNGIPQKLSIQNETTNNNRFNLFISFRIKLRNLFKALFTKKP